jgi:hypothetical protein
MAMEGKEKPKSEAEEAFEDAWEEDVEDEGGEDETPTEKESTEPEGEAKKEEPTSNEPEKKEESSEEKETPEEEPGKEPAKDDTPPDKPSYEELEKKLEETEHKYSTVSGMYNSLAKQKEDKKEEPPAEPQKEEPKVDLNQESSAITEEISKLESLKTVNEEHGEEIGKTLVEVAGILAKNLTSNFNERLNQRFGEVLEKVTPAHEYYVKTADEKHLDSIVGEHPDFATYVESGELKTWVLAHKGIEKEIFTKVYAEGSAAEIIDMVGKFRETKGYAEKEEPEPKKEPEIDDHKKKKLEDMEVVDTKKTPVSPGKGKGGKQDYENSWDEF